MKAAIVYKLDIGEFDGPLKEAIEYACQELRLSEAQIAHKLGWHPSKITRWKKNPPRSTAAYKELATGFQLCGVQNFNEQFFLECRRAILAETIQDGGRIDREMLASLVRITDMSDRHYNRSQRERIRCSLNDTEAIRKTLDNIGAEKWKPSEN